MQPHLSHLCPVYRWTHLTFRPIFGQTFPCVALMATRPAGSIVWFRDLQIPRAKTTTLPNFFSRIHEIFLALTRTATPLDAAREGRQEGAPVLLGVGFTQGSSKHSLIPSPGLKGPPTFPSLWTCSPCHWRMDWTRILVQTEPSRPHKPLPGFTSASRALGKYPGVNSPG